MNLADILSHIPVWVPVLFLALLAYGLSQTRRRSMTMRRTVIVPLVLLTLSVSGAITTFASPAIALTAWAAGVLASVAFGKGLVDTSRTSYSAEANRFDVPGSWTPLVLMMSLFALKFGVGMVMGLHPALRHDATLTAVASALYGAFSGGFLARSMALWTLARRGGRVMSKDDALGLQRTQ
ncbi:hypothetical protein BH09PSE5_BH09PSE5_46430 [soil metagenome]